MDWLELATGWLNSHIEDDQHAAEQDCNTQCHGETYAAALIAICQELRQIRELLENKPE